MNIAQAKTSASQLAERLRDISENDEDRTLEDVLAVLSDLADVADGISEALNLESYYDSEPGPI